MRRGLVWLAALPLMFAGSQVAHVLAYRWAYPDAPVRLRMLLATGHGYMAWLSVALGVAGAVAVLSFLLAVADTARGSAPRALPAWAFALLPPLGFTLQECLERFLYSGMSPWHAALGPTFVPGLVLQLPFAFFAYIVARLLLRAAERVGRALVRVLPPRRRVAVLPGWSLSVSAEPRHAVIAQRQAKRGPPTPLAA